jgi:hypothetical protein
VGISESRKSKVGTLPIVSNIGRTQRRKAAMLHDHPLRVSATEFARRRPQKWGRQSYRMDFTPSKIIAIKRALEPSARKCQLLHEKEPQHTVISAIIF